MDEDHAALAEDAAVAVVVAVDGGVVLVVRAGGQQREHHRVAAPGAGAVRGRVLRHRMREEDGLAGGVAQTRSRRRIGQAEAARDGDPAR